jgi:DNA (cytosine-5)-methyltransferase 1
MNHLELFSGIGGFRRALDLLDQDGLMNFNCVGYSEIDKNAKHTYQVNYNTDGEVDMGDIVAFTADENNINALPEFDFLTGGFPCQTFSVMGNQRGFHEDRGQMFFRIMDILHLRHPRYVLLENVKNLFRHDGGNTYARIHFELENEGYHVFSNIFNTSDFHLPQKRSRALIFATLEDVPDNFNEMFTPEAVKELFDQNYLNLSVSHYDSTLDILEEHVEDKYFLSDRIKPTILADGSANFRSRSDINQLIARTLTASMHKMHRACQDNYYSQDFIESHGEINHVYDYTKEQLAQLPIRKLTPQEAFMLQGFPAAFATNAQNQHISNGALYKQAGNAVSVNTIYAVTYYLIVNHIIFE